MPERKIDEYVLLLKIEDSNGNGSIKVICWFMQFKNKEIFEF